MKFFAFLLLTIISLPAQAALNIPITVNLSEAVNVTGTPRIPVDVGGTPRYATYTSGTGTNALTFTLSPQAGDVDLDGVTVSSPIDLNSGTITDTKGNPLSSLAFTPPNTANVKVNYPSLGMDFVYDADGRYTLNGTAYNDLTSFLTATGGSFTRASIGTYFDSSGNLQTAASGVPRFDYDPVTHAAKGILIEEQRTNLLTYSAMASTTGWSGSNLSILTVNNPGSLPAGASTCLRNEINTGQTFGFTTKNLTLSLATPYTFSVWAYIPSNVPVGKANLSAWYNNAGWQTISATPISERDQWVRKTLTFTTNATYATTIVGVGLSATTSGLQSYSCLAQLEQGSFATSFIPTTTTTVTRAKDTLTIPVNASWYTTSSVGSLSSQYQSYAPLATSTRIVSLSDGGASNVFQIADSLSGFVVGQKAVSGTVNNVTGPAYISGTSYKASAAFDTAGIYMAVNNAFYSSVQAGVPAAAIHLDVGHQNTLSQIDGWIQKIKYYPARIPNTQLQLLTQ